MKLGNYIAAKKIRKNRAANELAVSPQNLHQWICGKRIPRPEQMIKIYIWSQRQVQPNDFYDLSDPGPLEGLPLFAGNCNGHQLREGT